MKIPVSFLLILLIGCQPNIDSSQVVGNWIIESVKDQYSSKIPDSENYIKNLNDEYLDGRLVFRANGFFESPDDKFDDVHIYGNWELIGDQLIVNYDQGTGTEYNIMKISDSTLLLTEDSYTFKLSKLPFFRPANDTLRTGSYFTDMMRDHNPFFKIVDDDSDSILNYVTDSTTYFIWINNSILDNYSLEHYNFKIWSDSNCKLLKTARKNLYELVVSKTSTTDSISIDHLIT